jgi:hypothetical protein
MANEQREFWSKFAKEGRLGKLAEFGEHSNRIHQGCESLTGRSPKAEGF